MLVSTAFVLLMTIPGLALFYGGMVRKKNVLATMMQSFAICCLISVIWFVIGYSFAFSGKNPYYGDFAHLFLRGISIDDLNGTFPTYLWITFQMAFAIITPALITGAFAERMKFSAMLWFMGLWSLLVYAPICHWVWGGGFLGQDGVLDFAGGTVIHVNAGVAGLVMAVILGKREGYRTVNMAPHNLTLSMIGASLLWIGWFGFNAGSAGAANKVAAIAMLNTQIATAAGALCWMIAEWAVSKKPSVLGIISGAVAGLVAITPAAGFVEPCGAIMIGVIAGPVCYFAAVFAKRTIGYDDSLDAFGVHGIGGIIGALLTGCFASDIFFSDPDAYAKVSVLNQGFGLVVAIIYSAVVTAIILYIVKAIIGLRPTKQQEIEGLDLSLHGETIQ
ncbi:ammonium transporter [uncultured Bartonella sp.]|uniref:ammonium transporter n=1 Tax=uncultured Bartonella sp. TaxID=104108 RepID=UPI0026396DDE|nr:ammonium transporter [uncultured Bartonella sp.]